MASRSVAVAAVVIALIAGALYIATRAESTADARVRDVVTRFGTSLKDVSLLAPSGTLGEEMDRAFDGIVDPTLVTAWLQDPERAPGRLTSSPWPDHIEITDITQQSPSRYRVEGSLVDVSNEGGGVGEVPIEAARRPITLTVDKRGERWTITDVSISAYPGDGFWTYSEPDARGMQFMYPAQLPTSYISTSTQGWPPAVVISDETTVCAADPVIINDRPYCKARTDEGAAGSTYTTFRYSGTYASATATVTFTLRYPQCMNFDEPQQSKCMQEEKTFDVNGLADRIVSSIRFIR